MSGRLAWLCALVLGCGSTPAQLPLVDVKRGDLVFGLEVTGLLEAVDSTDIKPPPLPNVWNFKIAMLAPEGIEVNPGDPVIAFDPSEQLRELENMKNELEAATKKLEKRRDDAQLTRRNDELKISEAEAALHKARLKADAPGELVASVEQRQIELEAQAAVLRLDSAKNTAARNQQSAADEVIRLTEKARYAQTKVQQLQKAIASMQVAAPRAGTIVYQVNQEGEKLKVGDGVWKMQDILQIVGLGNMLGNGEVDEVDMARLADKQAVVLRLDALPDVELRGTVTTIAKTVQARSPTDPSKIVKLKITIEPTKVPLRPGMRFRGRVETELVPNVVQVPADAVFVTAGGPVAYRKTAGGYEQVQLKLGRRTQTKIEVVAGLAPGDRVSRVDPEAVP